MLKRPTNTVDKGIWPTTDNVQFSLPNAGYVNRANVDWEAFNIFNFDGLIGTGRINNPTVDPICTLAKAENEDWNAFNLGYMVHTTIGNRLHGAKNFIDNINGQTMLFSDNHTWQYIPTAII